jgi:hypothetical protein
MVAPKTHKILKELYKKESISVRDAEISGIICEIGYIKKFKWRWMATQMNLFIFIGSSNKNIDVRLLKEFSKGCLKYSLEHSKGWPRGIQSGIISIAILKGESVDNEGIAFCEQTPKMKWAALEIPVIYDQKEKKTTKFKSTPLWGLIYFPFINKTIDKVTKQLSQL